MKRNNLITILALVLTSSPMYLFAQEKHEHSEAERFGTVHFPITATAEVQQKFNRAVSLLHSFWYDRAIDAFSEVTDIDPQCAMGYWGVAMSYFHQIWEPPTQEELKKGREAARKAAEIGGKSYRERDYIVAIEMFYKDSDKLDHRARTLAYEKAMEQIYTRYPDDIEGAIFYALALNGTRLLSDKSYANQKKAGVILENVLAKVPTHPGLLHYMIHSYDYPPLAHKALAAARTYSRVAAASPHAQHMPSHIFTRLGLWDESIKANIASEAAANEYVVKKHPGSTSFDALHAMDYLAYAYLQTGQDKAAKKILENLNGTGTVDVTNLVAVYPFATIAARYALERRQWSEAAGLELPRPDLPWNKYRWAEAHIYFARALGNARSGQIENAKKDIQLLAAIRDSLTASPKGYWDGEWANQVEIFRTMGSAWIAFAEGKQDEAVSLMHSAADREDATDKHPVTPGSIVPAHELLGDLLLEVNNPKEALVEYERSFTTTPQRFNGFFGAAKAAERIGDRQKAQSYYKELVELCKHADTERPEILKAKEFLAQD